MMRFLLSLLISIPVALSGIGLLTVTTELAPASIWLSVSERNAVFISSAKVGEPVLMKVTRQINRPFIATWIAEVERKVGSGYSAFCTATGANEYAQDNQLPADLDLDWWTYPVQCELPVGEYRVTTVWTLDTGFFGFKQVRSVSNDFTISH